MLKSGTIIFSLVALLLPLSVLGQTEYRWSRANGFESAYSCRPSVEATQDRHVVYEMTSHQSEQIGQTGIELSRTFWQVARLGQGSVVYHCGNQALVSYDVFIAGSRDAVARVAMADQDAAEFFADAYALTPEEASLVAQVRFQEANEQDEVTDLFAADQVEQGHSFDQKSGVQSEDVALMDESLAAKIVVCAKKGSPVRDSSLRRVLMMASHLEAAKPMDGPQNRKFKRVGRHRYAYLKVQLTGRDSRKNTGWIAEGHLKSRAACLGLPEVKAPPVKPSPPIEPPPVPNPVPQPPPPAVVTPEEVEALLAPNCVKTTILNAAKENVEKVFGNRPFSHGKCALGVRLSLQKSRVGQVNDALGNAVDYLTELQRHGFVDSGLKDIFKAPAGSVLVFGAPRMESYLRTGRYGRPAGNWVGHVTIKGADGFFYTDARTVEPAIGWRNGRDVTGLRPLKGVFVPGKELVQEYVDKCK